MDVYWSENNICPTNYEYLLMISLKTTALFKLISNLINEIINIDTTELKNYLNLFGNYFQILDDYINLTDSKYWQKKDIAQILLKKNTHFRLFWQLIKK